MMRNDKGVTLTVLIITVLILAILISVTLQFNYDSMTEIRDNNRMAQLGIVRQAVIERYEQAAIVNQIKGKSKKEYWIGERIESFSNVDLPEITTINSNEKTDKFYNNKKTYEHTYPEDYYYRLKPDQLSQIGITDAKDTYIVNYSTGEVYNETKKKTKPYNEEKKGELLYLSPVNNKAEDKTIDEKSFNDWQK